MSETEERESAAGAGTDPRGNASAAAPYSFCGPDMGALAHLYRGEVYRSTIWRTRLDATTNWSVVSLGLALSISYASEAASALPLFLVGLLIGVFLYLEARRYRYFNVWRARARWLEIHLYAPMLRGDRYDEAAWRDRLAEDYERPEHHIGFRYALGRRLRRNYLWIFLVQTVALIAKGFTGDGDPLSALRFGPLPGWVTVSVQLAAFAALCAFTWYVRELDKKRFRERRNPISMG